MLRDFDSFFISAILILVGLLAALGYLYTVGRDKDSDKGYFLFSWNILLSIFAIYFLLFLGEVRCRFFLDRTDAFAITKMASRWFELHYHQNNLAFRDNVDYEMTKSNNTFRITFIGDSFTVGHGVRNVDDRFCNLLRKRFPQADIHVMARNGLDSDQQLLLLEELKRNGYQSDLFILVYNVNDIAYLSPKSQPLYDAVARLIENQNVITGNSYFINNLWMRWQISGKEEVANYYNYVKDCYFDSSWVDQVNTLQRIEADVRLLGAQFMVVTFPLLGDLSTGYNFAEVHTKLDLFWEKDGVPHLDLGPLFYGTAEKSLVVNKFDPHPNERAHRIAANAIGSFLDKRIPQLKIKD